MSNYFLKQNVIKTYLLKIYESKIKYYYRPLKSVVKKQLIAIKELLLPFKIVPSLRRIYSNDIKI